MDAATLQIAEEYLAQADSQLGVLISSQKLIFTPRSEDTFSSLTRSIIGQQVSVAAADAITKRFEAATHMLPAKVVNLSEDDVRAIGLSRQKSSYIRDLADHFVARPNIYDHLTTMSDNDVINELTQVKGIGLWTAQMFLLFTLGRSDVFAPDDIGLQRAIEKLYKWTPGRKRSDYAEIANTWSPYRSIASLHLWRSLDNMPK